MNRILKPVNNSPANLSDSVSEKIEELIKTSKLKPGDKLPNEASLCSMLNVSRGILRESVKLLVSRNVITIVRGVGTFVSDRPGITSDPLGFGFVQDKSQLIMDLLELRMIVEPSLVRLASIKATNAEIEKLEDIESRIEEAYASGADYADFDVEFHSAIASCSHNGVVEIIFPILTKAIPAVTNITGKSLVTESIRDHREIIRALKNKDSDLAEKVMKLHLERNSKYISEKEKKDNVEN